MSTAGASIIDKDGFAEAQPRGHGLAVLPGGHSVAVGDNAELVSVPTAGTAKHAKDMESVTRDANRSDLLEWTQHRAG
jgi:hypothetical protein